MNEENKEVKENKENSGKKESAFIRQTIKGRPISKKGWLIGLLTVCVFAAAAAIIGAFIFVNMVPVAEKISGKVTPTPRVTIPAVDTSTVVPTETPVPSVTALPTTTPTPSVEPEPTESPDKEEPAPEEPKQTELTVDQYLKLQDSMMDVAREASKSIVKVTAISSQMDYFNQSVENRQQISGVLIAESEGTYFVLTESRILKNIERIQVTFSNGFIADAIYQKEDPDTGMAVLKVDSANISEETINEIRLASFGNSYLVSVGDVVVALGSPNGYSNSISFGRITSTESIISAIDCEYNLLTTDIIGTADGSGILIDLNGNVVGIIDQAYSNNESQIVTGISISQLKTMIEYLSNGESRPYFGIRASEVTSSVSEITGIPKGILITSIEDESPAFYAGLTELDVLTQIGEEKITNMTQYKNILTKLTPGEDVTVIALRKGAEGYTEIEFTVKTGEI